MMLICIKEHYEPMIQIGIACNKISCYMRDLTCRWPIVEMLQYFKVMLKFFEFSHVKEIVEF